MLVRFLIKRLYAIYLAITLGFFYSFLDWQFWAVWVPVIFLVEEIYAD